MKTKINLALMLAVALTMIGASLMTAQQSGTGSSAPLSRPKGPCDIYGAAGDKCVAAHSTTRALYASYEGPLYQVLRQSDGKSLDINVVPASATDAGGYANAAAQDAFCANTHCWIAIVYDQSPKHNDLTQAPRGGFSGPAMGGFNNLPVADMAPVSIMGHKVYGVYIVPGAGIRQNDAHGTAVDDQAEGQYWVINGQHFNNGCCFDYGNAETDSRDDDNGTMETTYYGNATPWYHGVPPGPWVMTDQENNLVGCVNPDGSKYCADLPTVTWRFVTAMAKGEPHHWASLGGDAQKGDLKVMFDGPRVNATYDPMRKQGAILLGNGGDNSVGSQGTFYEGAMTAAGTYPTDATDQLVQANVVAARYAVQPVSLVPASAKALPPGLQTFTPGSSQESIVTFTNATSEPAKNITLSITAPKLWTAVAKTAATFAGPVAPGASVSATFKVTSGAAAYNGDLVATARWTNQSNGKTHSDTIAEKVRNVSPVKINEFRIASGPQTNGTDSFIELYNAGAAGVDISNWSLIVHPTQQPIFSSVKIPAGTKVASHGFYLLGLSNSGLTVPAHAGDTTISVRSTTGISVGDTITIDTGAGAETRKVAKVGSAASNPTTLWQPVPEGPVITIPNGSTNVPVTSTAGFAVGEKIAIGYGATYPSVATGTERYEVATVTEVGKPGTQAYFAEDAPAGATNIKVTSLDNISVGDKIRLDIDSVGHGIETVTVTHVGTVANHTRLMAAAKVGSSNIKVRGGNPFAGGANPFVVGDKLVIGTPANLETVTITAVNGSGMAGIGIDFTPALRRDHISEEGAVVTGTGLDLAAPLQFAHAANMPFGDRGTGITFQPATAFAHSSNEPVAPLGTGITLDSALAKDHGIDAVVRDEAVTTAGYQGKHAPSQWFGGPTLTSASSSTFGGPPATLSAGNMVLRDAAGLIVDSLNYGGVIDPWAAEGYQGVSGSEQTGCHVTAPGPALGGGGLLGPAASASDTSAGRFPDGADTDSNCNDFVTEPTTSLAAASVTGTDNIKVASVSGFEAGQSIRIDAGPNQDTVTIATVGTPGATKVATAAEAGATSIHVASLMGFRPGQTITIGSNADLETAVIASANRFGSALTISAPLTHAHAVGAQVSGTGITFTSALSHGHPSTAQVSGASATPGEPNQYYKKAN
jgi:non-reducing end alpha-L-arabinofuranosidase